MVLAFLTFHLTVLTIWKGHSNSLPFSSLLPSATSLCCWNVDFRSKQCQPFQHQVMHFGLRFEVAACFSLGILFAINSIQAIGDFTATTVGSMDREPTNKELKRGIVGYGLSNVLGSLLGGLPTATYSQNVGIVTTTKVITLHPALQPAFRSSQACPKFPPVHQPSQSVLGGATIAYSPRLSRPGDEAGSTRGDEIRIHRLSIIGRRSALALPILRQPSQPSRLSSDIFGQYRSNRTSALPCMSSSKRN